jgi:hypothetical protein
LATIETVNARLLAVLEDALLLFEENRDLFRRYKRSPPRAAASFVSEIAHTDFTSPGLRHRLSEQRRREFRDDRQRLRFRRPGSCLDGRCASETQVYQSSVLAYGFAMRIP